MLGHLLMIIIILILNVDAAVNFTKVGCASFGTLVTKDTTDFLFAMRFLVTKVTTTRWFKYDRDKL